MLGRIKTALRRASNGTAELEDVEGLLEEIEALSGENRASRDPERERRIMRLRQLAGVALTRQGRERPELVEPVYDRLPEGSTVPEVPAEDVTPELIRAAILRHGSILVRGLIDADDATRLAGEIDRAFAGRDAEESGEPFEQGYYDEFNPEPYGAIYERDYVALGGGVLAADSPRVAFDTIELFEQARVRDLVGGYLREPPTFSAHKTTLRKADPSVPGAWHQDGHFLGDVNSINLWLALSHCGDTAPGMDFVPRRLEHIVEAGVGSVGFQKIVVTQERAEALAGEDAIVRPIFEPGDAMFFDHLFLHRTASEPEMPNPRFAVESWFFGPSAFPEGYVPLAY